MAKGKIRYLVERTGTREGSRFYWQPSAALAAAGWRTQSLGRDRAEAERIANGWNAEVDNWRRTGKMLPGPKLKADKRRRSKLVRTGGVLAPESGVYVVAAAGLSRVKIGRSNDGLLRVEALATGSPDRLRLVLWVPCSAAESLRVERFCHQAFRHSWSHGEWFDLDWRKAARAVANCFFGKEQTADTRPTSDELLQLDGLDEPS